MHLQIFEMCGQFEQSILAKVCYKCCFKGEHVISDYCILEKMWISGVEFSMKYDSADLFSFVHLRLLRKTRPNGDNFQLSDVAYCMWKLW